MFFCETAPAKDGQTPLADMRAVYRKLPQELAGRFEKKGGLVLRRQVPAEKRYGFEVTWKTPFSASSKEDMEKIAKQNGWKMTWGKDGGLEVTHRPSPVVKTHAATGDRVWFNQAHLLHNAVAPWTSAWRGPNLTQRLRARLLQPFIRDRFFYHSTQADGSEISFSGLDSIRRVRTERW